MAQLMLIAETDETHRIVALWQAGGGLRSPRAITAAQARALLDRAQIEGASRAAVEDWIASQLAR
ncbi:MAG: hypothetical protein IE922_08255 [Sphingomonadales bacterium]|nr:hypothetical protein [Sphingomonadales bacterium]